MESLTDRHLEELRTTAIRMGSLADAILAKALRAAWGMTPDELDAAWLEHVLEDYPKR